MIATFQTDTSTICIANIAGKSFVHNQLFRADGSRGDHPGAESSDK